MIRDIVSKRVQATFEPFKGAKRKQATKIPIKVLVEQVKRTPGWVHFNPTLWLNIIGATVLPALSINSQKDEDRMQEQLRHCFASMTSAGITHAVADTVLIRYEEYLKELYVD